MSVDVNALVTDNLDIWSSTIKAKSATGRGSKSKRELYGIKKLRELILELAVRGLLVPQDSSNEPASTLLTKISKENTQLVKEKKIRKRKALPPISNDEKPFDLPKSWSWARLGETCKKITDGSHNPPTNAGEGYPMLSSQNVYNNKIDFNKPSRYVTEADFIKEDMRTSVEAYDVLLNIVASIGRSAVVPENAPKFVLQRSVAVLSSAIDSYYFAMMLVSPLCLNYYDKYAKGTAQKGIYLGKLSEMPLSIPPEAEQHRIVTKVNELMTLCDQLEQQQEYSITAHQTLVETLLNALVETASHTQGEEGSNKFQQAWQRIAENFDLLFTTEHSIDQLKQTILQLAVMGKLVPQNPNDEPASVLLEKIAEEKAQLIKDKKLKKQKPLPPIGDEEKPFELPEGWEWCRLEDVVEIYSGITKGRKLAGRELVTVPYLSVANVQRSHLNLINVKEVDIPVEETEKYKVVNGDLLITEGGDWDKVGRTAIWRDELEYVAHQNHVFKARVFLSNQSENWLEMYLNCPFSRDYFAGSSKQTTNLASINKTQLRGCLIAVPPAKEKEKIISTINQFITLCDNMLDRIKAAQTTQLNLTDAIAEQAVQ